MDVECSETRLYTCIHRIVTFCFEYLSIPTQFFEFRIRVSSHSVDFSTLMCVNNKLLSALTSGKCLGCPMWSLDLLSLLNGWYVCLV